MSIKLKKNSDYLANVQIPGTAGGYNSLEVDALLDQIIKDYETVEQNCLLSKEEYQDLKDKITNLSKENTELRVELDNEKGRWKYIKNDGKDIHIDNLELLQRIGKLERIIVEKLHLNPDKITTFDPDDY